MTAKQLIPMNYHKFCRVMAMSGLMVLAGCATSKDELLPHGDATMQDLWMQGGTHTSSQGTGTGKQELLDQRSVLRRPLDDGAMVDQRAQYTRDASNEIRSQFSRLPNPDIVMYIYPHLAGEDPVPVPGYSTVFSMYSRPQYAMPGEMARPSATRAQTGRTR